MPRRISAPDYARRRVRPRRVDPPTSRLNPNSGSSAKLPAVLGRAFGFDSGAGASMAAGGIGLFCAISAVVSCPFSRGAGATVLAGAGGCAASTSCFRGAEEGAGGVGFDTIWPYRTAIRRMLRPATRIPVAIINKPLAVSSLLNVANIFATLSSPAPGCVSWIDAMRPDNSINCSWRGNTCSRRNASPRARMVPESHWEIGCSARRYWARSFSSSRKDRFLARQAPFILAQDSVYFVANALQIAPAAVGLARLGIKQVIADHDARSVQI